MHVSTHIWSKFIKMWIMWLHWIICAPPFSMYESKAVVHYCIPPFSSTMKGKEDSGQTIILPSFVGIRSLLHTLTHTNITFTYTLFRIRLALIHFSCIWKLQTNRNNGFKNACNIRIHIQALKDIYVAEWVCLCVSMALQPHTHAAKKWTKDYCWCMRLQLSLLPLAVHHFSHHFPYSCGNKCIYFPLQLRFL